MKFQPATLVRPTVLLLAGAAVVLLAGEAARQAAWPLLTAVAAVGLVVAVCAWLQQGPGERGMAVGLLLLSIGCGVAAGMIGHTKLHANALPEEAVVHARAERDRLLKSAVAAARNTAKLALDRVGVGGAAISHNLNDLVGNSDVESAVAVIAGDTVLAVAGPHRMQPITSPSPASVISTPFARMLVIRETRNERQAHVVLLLDSLPGLPVAGPSLAAASGMDVLWTWTARFDHTVEFSSSAGAIAGVIDGMRPIAAPVSAFLNRQASAARLLVGAGMLVFALILLLTTSRPAVRAGALLVPLWALARSNVGTTMLGVNSIRALLAAVALLLLAVVLWRRPARRTAVGLAASVLLLGTAPPLVVLLARSLVPRRQVLSLLTGFGWEVIVALATAGFLAVAMAPLRAPDDKESSSRWGLTAIAAALIVGMLGVMAWGPGTSPVASQWAPWYAPLWLVPIGLLLPLTTPRIRLVAMATIAGIFAALATWATSLDRSIELAAADLGRLNAPADSTALKALDRFAVAALQNHATRLNRLYATWRASQLASDSVPTYLSLWSAAGNQREFVALDSLSVSWFELDSLVRTAGSAPKHFPLSRRVGHHDVLILPLAPDTIATVTIGPRSRLLVPTTFGLLVGWRSPPSDPPYKVYIPSDAGSPLDGRFRRTRHGVRADTTAGDPPRVVRAEVEMFPPGPFFVRAALGVLLDVGLILGVWLLLQRLLSQQHTAAQQMFRQSYRRTVASALMAFFIVPAIVFTLLSALRLQREAKRQHDAEVATALRVVRDAGGLTVAESLRPRSQPLAIIADTANAEVGVYRQGRLIAASDSMLTELGLLPPIVSWAAAGAGGSTFGTLASSLPAAALRLGVMGAATPGTALLVALPGGDTGLATEQIDQALLLLLATLAGIVASMLVAGVIARALGRPIETLRRTAVAIGRREVPPVATDVPAEFVPVFGAITQMERDLRATEAELQAGRVQTARVLAWGEMARQVAHEIKNPLTPMRLGLQHLRRVRSDNALNFPQLVDDTAERLLLEIERLDRIARSFARYGAPPERATPLEPIDLQSVTEEIVSLFALGAERMRIEVVGASNPVPARHEELVQVLLNLLENARQAGAASVRLVIGDHTLRIADDGKGVPADQIARIFEPSFSTNTSGTGLGLAIVRRLVEGWESTIGVESAPGAGAVFTIRFATEAK